MQNINKENLVNQKVFYKKNPGENEKNHYIAPPPPSPPFKIKNILSQIYYSLS